MLTLQCWHQPCPEEGDYLVGRPGTFVAAELRTNSSQATEAYWAGKISEQELQTASQAVRKERWDAIKAAGVDIIPSGE